MLLEAQKCGLSQIFSGICFALLCTIYLLRRGSFRCIFNNPQSVPRAGGTVPVPVPVPRRPTRETGEGGGKFQFQFQFHVVQHGRLGRGEGSSSSSSSSTSSNTGDWGGGRGVPVPLPVPLPVLGPSLEVIANVSLMSIFFSRGGSSSSSSTSSSGSEFGLDCQRQFSVDVYFFRGGGPVPIRVPVPVPAGYTMTTLVLCIGRPSKSLYEVKGIGYLPSPINGKRA